jgi:hypothetical protein
LGTGLGTTIKYVRRTARGDLGNGFGTTIKYLRRTRNGFLGNGLGTTIKYLRRTRNGAGGNGLGTTAKCLRRSRNGFSGSGLGTSIKYLCQTTAAGNRMATTVKRPSACVALQASAWAPRLSTREAKRGNFSLDGSSLLTGDAAFTPATPHDLHHSRANTDSHNSHHTKNTRV